LAGRVGKAFSNTWQRIPRNQEKETQSMNAGRYQTLMDINFSLDLGDAVRKE
jgi:hypothetical protein